MIQVCLVATANAVDLPQHAETGAMGQTAAADPFDNASIPANPALHGLGRRYDVQAGLAFGPLGAWRWTASAVDARTSDQVGIGLAYTGASAEPAFTTDTLPGWSLAGEEPSNRQREHDLAGGLSLAFLDRRVSLGLGGDLLFYNHDIGGEGVTGDIDLGLGGRPIPWLTLGVAAVDLLQIDPVGRHESGLTAGLRAEDEGIGALAVSFAMPFAPGSVPALGAGGEVRIGTAALRTGWHWNAADPVAEHVLSFGIGAQSEAGAIGYALLVPITGSNDVVAGLVNIVSLRIAAPEGPPVM